MEFHPILENRTVTGYSTGYMYTRSRCYDRRKLLYFLGGACAGLLSSVLLVLSFRVPGWILAVLSLGLLWMPFLRSLLVKPHPEREVLTVFTEKGILRIYDDPENPLVYPYSRIKRLLFLPHWLLVEGKNLCFVLDLRGFGELSPAEVFQYFREQHPDLSLKQKPYPHVWKQLLSLIPITLVFAFLLVYCFLWGKYLQRDPTPVVPTDHSLSQKYADTPIEQQPCIPFDLDLFSMELPAGFSAHPDQGYGLYYSLYGADPLVSVGVFYQAKVYWELEEIPDLKTFAEYERLYWKADPLTVQCDPTVSTNAYGHLSFSVETKTQKKYCVYLDGRAYATSIYFTCPIEDAPTYETHFAKWEASITPYAIATKTLMGTTQRHHTQNFSVEAPLYMILGENDGAELCLLSAENLDIYLDVFRYEKGASETITGCAEALEDFSGIEAKAFTNSIHGNLSICCGDSEDDTVFYYIIGFESEDSYYVLEFGGPNSKIETLLPIFEEMEGSFKLK